LVFLALSLFSALGVGEPPVDSLFLILTVILCMDEEYLAAVELRKPSKSIPPAAASVSGVRKQNGL
jgi:hypothetical protein